MAAPRPLTPRELALKTRFFAGPGNTYGADDFLPNDGFITNVGYDSSWYNIFFKEFMAAGGTDNHNLEMLNRYEGLISLLPQTVDRVKKELSVRNRKRELLVKAYYFQNPAAVRIDKVVCCIIRNGDNFGLFLQNNNGQYGYPKGDIEYSLFNNDDIQTVRREPPTLAALRELEEETGFRKTAGSFGNTPIDVVLEYNTDSLTIVNAKVESRPIQINQVEYRTFFLILYTNTVQPLTDLTLPPSAAHEGIVAKTWRKQYSSLLNSQNSFNEYSRKPQMYKITPPGLAQNKANTYLGGARTKIRTRVIRRNRIQKKRKSKAKAKATRKAMSRRSK